MTAVRIYIVSLYHRALNAYFKLQTTFLYSTYILNMLLNLRVQSFEKSAYSFGIASKTSLSTLTPSAAVYSTNPVRITPGW
jgi:hypothetical protein